MSRGSLQALPVKLMPNGAGLAWKLSGNGGLGLFGIVPNGTMTVGYPGFAAMDAPVDPGNSNASSLYVFKAASMPCVPASRMSLARSASYRGRSASRSISSEMSSSDCPYFMEPAAVWERLNFRSSASDLTGADGPKVASHLLKSRFMPYLNTIEQFSSCPLASLAAEQVFHRIRLSSGVSERTLGISAGST